MSLETIAGRYAEALYEIGLEQGHLHALAEEVRRLGETYAESAELRSVLDNPLVEEVQRKAILQELCDRLGVGMIARNALSLLASRHRLILLPLIARVLARQSDEKVGVLRASVTTAMPLPDGYYAKLKDELERSSGKKVVLERKVDPSLLGGVITRVGDRVIDGSVKARLESMKQALLVA